MAGEEDTGTQCSRRMVQRAMGIGMLGRRQVTPRWVNDPVWRHDDVNGIVDRGGCRHPLPDGKQVEVGEGRSGLRRVVSYVTINDGA